MPSPVIESLKVRNFRMLRDVELMELTPLTVLVGPNGSGKSTLLDVFDFLRDCFARDLRYAWDKRGGIQEIRSRDSSGPVEIRIQYREKPKSSPITYHLSIDEIENEPVVIREWMEQSPKKNGRKIRFLNFNKGLGNAEGSVNTKKKGSEAYFLLASNDMLAASAIGRTPKFRRIHAFRNFIRRWQFANISPEICLVSRTSRAQRKIDRSGRNLANVIKYLSEKHPDKLEEVFHTLRQRVPSFDKAFAVDDGNGKISLMIKDYAFMEPFQAKFSSEGILKMLAYLVGLKSPILPTLIAIEEPENFVYPRLFHLLADELLAASNNMQVIVATHSPFFLDAMRPDDVRMVWRDQNGFAKVERVSDSGRIMSFLKEGGMLGDLWMEGQFSGPELPFRKGKPAYMREMG